MKVLSQVQGWVLPTLVCFFRGLESMIRFIEGWMDTNVITGRGDQLHICSKPTARLSEYWLSRVPGGSNEAKTLRREVVGARGCGCARMRRRFFSEAKKCPL